jgi:flagellar motor switch protein FliN/FliY
MLTQEELDKLLNEEGGGSGGEEKADQAGQQEQAGTEAASGQSMSQDELDKLMAGDSESGGTDESQDGDEQPEQQDIDWSDAFKEAAQGGDAAAAKAVQEGAVEEQPQEDNTQVNTPEFGELTEEPSDSDGTRPELDFLLEIPLDISVELGRRSMRIKDLLQLSQGSVVELNKMAGEPADIYVNKKLMAKGEVVVVNEKFGIKLTEIISPAERVKSLG